MMANFGIDISELKKLEQDLKNMSAIAKLKVINNGLEKGANLLRDEVKKRVPTRTGKLRSDIVAVTNKKNSGIYIKGKGSASKANWLEYGTSKMPPRSFIRTAYDNNEEKVIQMVVSNIIQDVEKGFNK